MPGALGALVVATYLLVADGLAALWIGGLLGAVGLSLVALGVVGSWWQERLRAPLARVRGGDTVPALVAAAASALDLVYLAESVVDGFVHLLLFLLLYRLFTRRTLRDLRDVGFICFFLLVAAAPGTFDIGFLLVFVVFLVLATWMLMLRHVLVESERVAEVSVTGAAGIHGRHVLRLSVVASAATLLITASLFFVIPRIGQATLSMRARITRMVSGFSEHVRLGAFGEIETDSAVVMRVHIPEGFPGPEQMGDLRWRGIALDQFDGRAWTRAESERTSLRRLPGSTFELGRPRAAGLFLAQEVYLEPLGTHIIFAAPRALRLGIRTETVLVDGAGSISVPAAAARLQYTVESEIESFPPRRGGLRPAPLETEERQRYLQLPPLAPRVGFLAREVTGEATDRWTSALKLNGFLSTQYRYSRLLDRQTSLPPVEEFLFVSRSGNCEYFAASLAVMLRSVGIPTRVVNGFQRGEWNPYGRYFMVRFLDAHSWVEAWFDDAGWVALDPSPRGGQEAGASAGPALYLDAFRMSWYRYVVNWSLRDQVAAAGKVRQAATMWTPSLAWVRRPGDVSRGLVAAALAVVIAVALVLLLRRGAWSRRAVARRAPPRFYERALRALARRGFRPEPGETAREFAARVEAGAPSYAAALARITVSYERVRFGAAALTREDLAALDACVAALAGRT